MNRRELLGQSSLAIGALAATSVSGVAMAAAGKESGGLVKAASDCVAVGQECLTHCLESLATGDKMMADCSKTVRDTIAACQGLIALAASKSKHLKEYAAVCAKICRDCEAACKKHAEHHEICKRCMEACAHCAKACDAA